MEVMWTAYAYRRLGKHLPYYTAVGEEWHAWSERDARLGVWRSSPKVPMGELEAVSWPREHAPRIFCLIDWRDHGAQ